MVSELSALPIQFRVLIVDDESSPRLTNKRHVRRLGFEPITAEGIGESLIKDAEIRAYKNFCHLALIDMKLDSQVGNTTGGLSLLKKLPDHLMAVIVSGTDQGVHRTSPEVLTEAQKNKNVTYIKKGDLEFRSKLWEFFKKHWNYQLLYDWSKTHIDPSKIISRLNIENKDGIQINIPSDEIDNLLMRAFNHEETELDIESVENPYASSDNASSLHNSVVLFAKVNSSDRPIHSSEIIKFAPKEDIKREYANYKKFVRTLAHQFTALIESEPTLSWQIGMIRYTDETTGNRKIFTDWYKYKTSRDVNQAISHLFNIVLKPWYERRSEDVLYKEAEFSMYDYYTDVKLFRKLANQIEGFPNKERFLNIRSLDGSFINPVEWAKRHRYQSKLGYGCCWFNLIHGDLHPGNIIVDEDAKTYIIDYERTGYGFYLRDFVELEKHIRVQLLDIDKIPLNLSFYLESQLLMQTTVDTLPSWNPPVTIFDESAIKEVNKAFEAVKSIREAAINVGGLKRLEEYYWALLMETLLTVTNPKVTGLIHERALLSASLICQRLKNWKSVDEDWLPKEMKKLLNDQIVSSQTVTPTMHYQLTPNDQSTERERELLKLINALHLSDIHLGTMDQAKVYFSQLKADLLNSLGLENLDYLILNGDIADKANIDEYKVASWLVETIASQFNLSADKIIVVPGNHDVSYTQSRQAYSQFVFDPIASGDEVKRHIVQESGRAICDDETVYEARLKPFADFYEKVRQSTYPLARNEQVIVQTFPDHKLLFLSLNSAHEVDHFYQKRASIYAPALAHGLAQINTDYKDWLKIAVWHHPLAGAEAMNTEFMEQLAVNGFQICMHGHIHEAIEDFRKFDDLLGLRVIGAGTFGAPVRQQTTSIPLQYNLITLDPNECSVTVKARKKEKPEGAWMADPRWGEKLHHPQSWYSFKVKWGLCACDKGEKS